MTTSEARLGWTVVHGEMVECPGCGFTMGAEHVSVSEDGDTPGEAFYDCPNCGDSAASVATPCTSGTTADGIQFRGQLDPNMSEEAKVAFGRIIKAAHDQLAPMVEKATIAVLEYERAIIRQLRAIGKPDEDAAAQEVLNVAREKVLEYATKPIMVATRDASDDAKAEIAYLQETCTRQQKELGSLREQAGSLASQRTALEESNRLLRLEAEDIGRVLAKAQEQPGSSDYAWPIFEESSMVRFIGDLRRGTDVPICAGDSVAVVAKAIAMRMKHLRERPTQ